MLAKHEWRKKEKSLYLPKNKPEIVDIPKLQFLTISGEGSPADPQFTECIGALYSLAYGIKMLPKKMDVKPKGYFDFTVYPLEGVWDINDKAKQHFTGTINKRDLVYTLMIRQPDFINQAFFNDIFETVMLKKNNPILERIKFTSITEGPCIQMLHLGKFENEKLSFDEMEAFAASQGLERVSKVHREIYLSDTRKVAPDKLRTVLRFQTQISA